MRLGIAALLACWSFGVHAGSSATFTSNPESVNGGAGPANSATFASRHILGQGYIPGTASSASGPAPRSRR